MSFKDISYLEDVCESILNLGQMSFIRFQLWQPSCSVEQNFGRVCHGEDSCEVIWNLDRGSGGDVV